MKKVLLIDNLDSFTFNLVEAFERLGCTVRTFRNSIDSTEAVEMADRARALIVISPGPGGPEEAGSSLEIVARAKGRIPLLGICLGHQAILAEAGARVVRVTDPVHGKASLVEHDGRGPFAGLPNPLRVGRYHSLGVRDVPPGFHVHCRADAVAMAVSDSKALQIGLQFHPESILSPEGDRILGTILGWSSAILEKSSRGSPIKKLTERTGAGTISA